MSVRANDEARVELGKHVVDKDVVDSRGLRCGKVDDLLLRPGDDGRPVVAAIITGPLAFAGTLGPWAVAVARYLHRLLGVDKPAPVEVDWDHVDAIDVVVRVDIDSEKTDLRMLAEAVGEKLGRIPGA